MDAISPALEHAKRQLMQPFRLGQWTRLALVGLLAGELSSGGGCSPPNLSNLNGAHRGATPGPFHLPAGIDPALLAGMIAVILAAVLVIWLVLLYVSSVMRFILFDSVLTRECHIREGWGRRQGAGWRYFLWKLAYTFATFGIFIIVVGIPAGLAFAAGWFRDPGAHIGPLILTGLLVGLVFGLIMIVALTIYVLTKDFVVPQMALEDIGPVEGWRRLWALMKAEKGGFAGYVGMKVVLAIAAGIVIGIVIAIVSLIFLIPVVGVAIAAVMAAKSAGVGWTASTITMAIVSGSAVLVVFLYIGALLSVPATVFFPAYSMYFFAGRYPALAGVLYPAPPAPVVAPAMPPAQEPPPLPPPPIG